MIDDALMQMAETKKKPIKATWVDLTAKEFHLSDSEALVPLLKFTNEDIRKFFELVLQETKGESRVNLIAINTITKQYGLALKRITGTSTFKQ